MLWSVAGLQAAPREGDVLDGRFRIDGLIGHGGFGAVYAATQLNLQRRVALKVLRPEGRRRGIDPDPALLVRRIDVIVGGVDAQREVVQEDLRGNGEGAPN
jgi:serine/threonine protein kinase